MMVKDILKPLERMLLAAKKQAWQENKAMTIEWLNMAIEYIRTIDPRDDWPHAETLEI